MRKSSITLDEGDVANIKIQIKKQKKSLKTFPFAYILLFFFAFARNNGRMPEFYFYPISFIFLIIPYLYSPLNKGILLGKIFYKLEYINDNTIQLRTFSTLWRNEKEIIADLKDTKIDKTPLPKLLYKKYELNAIYIGEKKYYIFNKLLVESGIAN